MPLGLYISVPFCRSKCSFCNFASGVFSPPLLERYVAHLERELRRAAQIADQVGGCFEREVDSIYLGGGTPSILAPEQLKRIFASIGGSFTVQPAAEVTVECAPGTLTPEMGSALVSCGVNRVSLGAQSWIDHEARSVGRLHTRAILLGDIERLRDAGITEISIDLIAGLPHQTAESWRYSLAETVAAGVPHVSVYMLEVDEDSRLGRELIAGGTRYHAHHVPDEDLIADFYAMACEELAAAGIEQYEISNFARGSQTDSGFPAHASRHNLKYWLRQPYMGFGVDAHSMLLARGAGSRHSAVRFATGDELEALLSGSELQVTRIDERLALEETWFLGLRLNRGVELSRVECEFGAAALEARRDLLSEFESGGLLAIENGWLRLTARGRLLSNEIFSRFVA
jgi:oxygen-independent coproporphyrinogen-3 oxidase